MDPFVEVGFVSGWIGVLFCIFSFIILSFKTREQIHKIKKNTDNEDNTHMKQDTICLLFYAFSSTVFTSIYCVYYGTYGTLPSRFNIIMTENICQFTAQWMANGAWQLARCCFYNFMLWRIKASFREPQSLKLGNLTFYTFIILIHSWLIFVLCITIFWTPRSLTPTGICGVDVEIIHGKFTTSDIRVVAWGIDLALTTCLLSLFLRKLWQLTQQNEKINAYKRKTIILGLLATLTSVTMALCIYFMKTKEWRYFIPIDMIINLSCIVFTFKFSMRTMCPTMYQKWRNCNNNGDICSCLQQQSGTNDQDEDINHHVVNQESTISAQPRDSEVWNMLVKSQGPLGASYDTTHNYDGVADEEQDREHHDHSNLNGTENEPMNGMSNTDETQTNTNDQQQISHVEMEMMPTDS